MDTNNTNYPLELWSMFKSVEYDDDELKYHQFLPYTFFTTQMPRGLNLFLDPGYGKTRTVIKIATYCATQTNRRVVVMLNKSLENNFIKEIEKTGKTDIEFNFITLNASNMFKKVLQYGKTKEEILYEKKLGDFLKHNMRENAMENTLLLIDEAHNLFNGICNGAKNALALYDLIMKTKNIKLLFMTGTPIINNPFECVPCYNMTRGLLKSPNGLVPLFNESPEEFEEYFIDVEKNTIKNKSKFINRIFGLTSYYGGLYLENKGKTEGFPKELETQIIRVPMSTTQFAQYTSAREQELEETTRGYKTTSSRFSSMSGGSSTYRVKTRQICNYSIPEYAWGPTRQKQIHKIKHDDLRDTQTFSPKFMKIICNIQKHPQQIGMVYSQFVNGEGLILFAKVLHAYGWKNIEDEDQQLDELEQRKGVKAHKYVLLSGDVDHDKRHAYLARINRNENSDGSDIRLILISSAMAEGTDLKNVRHVHIMEPFWNMARINQVKARAIRYKSHDQLPPQDQNVQVYIYLSDYPKGHPKKKITEETTDVDLYHKSERRMKLIDQFILAIVESSIDCSVHREKLSAEIKKKIKCKMCSPTNEILFHPLIEKDMEMEDNCKEYTESKVTVQEILLPDTQERYYYNHVNDQIKLYMYDDKLQGYKPMPKSHANYGALMKLLISSMD